MGMLSGFRMSEKQVSLRFLILGGGISHQSFSYFRSIQFVFL